MFLVGRSRAVFGCYDVVVAARSLQLLSSWAVVRLACAASRFVGVVVESLEDEDAVGERSEMRCWEDSA